MVFLSTLNYDARSATHQIYKREWDRKVCWRVFQTRKSKVWLIIAVCKGGILLDYIYPHMFRKKSQNFLNWVCSRFVVKVWGAHLFTAAGRHMTPSARGHWIDAITRSALLTLLPPAIFSENFVLVYQITRCNISTDSPVNKCVVYWYKMLPF